MFNSKLFVISVAVSISFMSGCGGGASITGKDNSSLTSISYTAAAIAGELLTYTVDTTNLTYSYTITESQYGLTGNTGTGTLIHNSDGTYSPTGIANARVAILPNGLLLGAIRETLNGTLTTIPIVGMSNPVTDLNVGAGTYNFVQRSCLSTSCASAYGTFQISTNATWTTCISGNLSGCTSTGSGTLNNLGGGKWQVMHGATNIGTAIMLNSGAQNVVVLDLKDTRAGGFGVGILVGSSQQSMTTAQTNGTWFSVSTTGHYASISVSGGQFSYLTIDGVTQNSLPPLTLTFNTPWTGMATTPNGGYGLLAGTGVYAYEQSNGYAEIGLKLN